MPQPTSAPQPQEFAENRQRSSLRPAIVVGLLISATSPLLDLGIWSGGLEWAATFLSGTIQASCAAGYVVAAISAQMTDLMLLLLVVRRWEREGWSSIGLKPTASRDALSAVLAGVITKWTAGVSVVGLVNLAIRSVSVTHPVAVAYPQVHVSVHGVPIALQFAAVLVGSTFEEIATRAYVIERVASLTGRLWIAGCGSLTISILYHVPVFGLGGAVNKAPGLLVLVLFYLWRRNVLASALAHFTVDAVIVAVVATPAPVRRLIVPWTNPFR